MYSSLNKTFKQLLSTLETIERSKRLAGVKLPEHHYAKKRLYQAVLEETEKEEPNMVKIDMLLKQIDVLT